LAAVGLRFLNPLFTAAAAAALSATVYAAAIHRPDAHLPAAAMAGTFCFAAAFVALPAGGIEFQRPSYDRMLDWLVVTMPLAGYLWLGDWFSNGVFPAHAPLWLLLPFAAAALIVGIRRRAHAPLLGFMVSAGCVGFELRNVTSLSVEAKLILWGSAVFALSYGLGRYLRTPRGGISSLREAEDDEIADLVQLAGAGGLAPHSAAQRPAEFMGGGGAGGGGGASGGY
jgi:hypothetical protein